MEDLALAAQKVADLLQAFISYGGLKLRFRVTMRSLRTKAGKVRPAADGDTSVASEESPRDLFVEFSGPDTEMLTARNGELLNALEQVATQILRLEPGEHDRVTFDADHFKADRDDRLRESAAAAVERVRTTGRPYSFPPMTSRERRLLHLVLAESGLPTASSGEGPGRFVVLYPEGGRQPGPADGPRRHDTTRLREAFRHR